MSGYPEAPLSSILTPTSNTVDVVDSEEYETAGIYSYARGLFRRPTIRGADTKYRKYNRLSVGQIVYSKLFGWEGAIAYVTSEFDGLHVSHEFPTYAIDLDKADPLYLRHLISWPSLHADLSKGASGMGSRRQRVNPERFLAAKVPLPALGEQRRVANRLDALLTKQTAASSCAPSPEDASMVAIGGMDRILERWADGTVTVGQACNLVSDTVHPGEDPAPAKEFVGLEHITPHFGERIGSLPLGGEKGRKFRFAQGDVLYGYLRPYLNKVWLADRHGLCSVEQFVLRPNGCMPAALLSAALRSRATLDKAVDATHSLQLPRLRSGLLLAMEIPSIPEKNHNRAISDVASFMASVQELNSLQRRRDAQLKILRPAVLNAAFAGRL
ncbi:hypothetical protein [Streptomyces sp. NPDC048340]|uniref:hypothetical protein n=1 Tax=Streptomyces sp. NPDC048340 TaxID=3365537 RepID=UPI0037218FED